MYISGLMPSNCRYSVLRPASLALLQNSTLSANLMPFVAAWTWAKPISFAAAMMSMNLGWIVGSPPENCTAGHGTGLSSLTVLSILMTVS